MKNAIHETGDRVAEGDGATESPTQVESAFKTAPQCGERYEVSVRHWSRLVESGKAPQPVRFGRLTRWSLQTLKEWEAAGCPPVRQAGRASR